MERAGNRRLNEEPTGAHSIQRGQSLDVMGGINIVVYTFPTVRALAPMLVRSLRTATGLAVSGSESSVSAGVEQVTFDTPPNRSPRC